jgi:chromosome partitioning protein
MAVCRTLSDAEVETVRAFIQDAGYAVLPGAIPERIAYREAQNRGRAITEATSTKLNARVDMLMDALLERVMSEIKRARRARGKSAVS